MDWGTISSWIAASIAVLTYAATIFRTWWNRPVADWLYKGEVTYSTHKGDWLEVVGTLSNVGDGNAHRVTLWCHHNDQWTERVETVALLRPGDSMEFTLEMHVENLETAEVWAHFDTSTLASPQ